MGDIQHSSNESLSIVSRVLVALFEDVVQHTLPFELIDCWDRVRIQLRANHDNSVLPQETVVASPPSSSFPGGLSNFVLVDLSNYDDAITSTIAGSSRRFVTTYDII